jgi:hypothetical protein
LKSDPTEAFPFGFWIKAIVANSAHAEASEPGDGQRVPSAELQTKPKEDRRVSRVSVQ